MKNPLNHPAVEAMGQRVAAMTQEGINRSRQMAEITRLKLNNRSEEEAIKKAYMELGKLYYAEHGTAPDGIYVALCSRISKCNDAIEANLAQIALLRSAPNVTEADFDDEPMEEPILPEEELEEEPTGEEVLTAEEDADAECIPDEE